MTDNKKPPKGGFLLYGGACRVRTDYPRLAKAMLSQMS